MINYPGAPPHGIRVNVVAPQLLDTPTNRAMFPGRGDGVNHCDLARTSHLAGGEPGSVAKARTATGALPQRLQEDAVARCDR